MPNDCKTPPNYYEDLLMSKEALLLGTAGKGHVTQSARMFKRETSFGCTCPARGGETRALEAKPRLSFAFGSQETKAGRRGGAGRGRRRGQRCWHRGARRLGTEARGPRWGHRRRDRVAGTDAGAEVGTEARRQTRGQTGPRSPRPQRPPRRCLEDRTRLLSFSLIQFSSAGLTLRCT